MCTHVPVQEDTSIILLTVFVLAMALRLISVLNFHLEWNSRTLRRRWWGSGSSKASGTTEQELTVVWQEKKLHFSCGSFVGEVVSWEWICIFLQEWYKPGRSSYKSFPHWFQPLFSLVYEEWLAGARKPAGTQTAAMASKRQSPTGASITCSLVQTPAQEARSSPCTPKTLHLQSMAYRKSISIIQLYSIDTSHSLNDFEYSRRH